MEQLVESNAKKIIIPSRIVNKEVEAIQEADRQIKKALDPNDFKTEIQSNNNLSHAIFGKSVFPSNLGTAKRGDLTEFMHFEARASFYSDTQKDNKKFTKKDEETVWNCFLPMPKQLQHNQGHSYQNKAIGQNAQAVSNALGDLIGGDTDSAYKGLVGQFVQNATNKLRNVGTTLGGALTGTDLESALQIKTQTKPNPNMEVLYDGSGFRTFNFAWDFIPDNLTEQIELKRLTDLFRFYAAPEFPESKNKMWLNFPNTWRINFKYANDGALGTSSDKNKWIPEIYDCVCSNVQLSFNDGQPRWHSRKETEGAPLQYTLQLSFTETSISSKNLIVEKDF